MKRITKIIGGIVLAAAAIGVLVWQPWHHATMAESLVEVPAAPGATPLAGRGDVVAIFYSGDGGWRDLDKQLGAILAKHGVPVMGVSLLKYYWRESSAEASAIDLDALIEQSTARLDKRRVWLIGFSFGADVLPSIIEHLKPENRARVAQLVLLSPSKDVSYEIEMQGYMVEGWFKTQTQNLFQRLNPVKHYDARAPLLALDGHPPVMCYYGKDDEEDTICATPGLPSWIKVYQKPGDHHFDYDYEGLARQMIADLPPSGLEASPSPPHP